MKVATTVEWSSSKQQVHSHHVQAVCCRTEMDLSGYLFVALLTLLTRGRDSLIKNNCPRPRLTDYPCVGPPPATQPTAIISHRW